MPDVRICRPGLWNASTPPEHVEVDLFYVNYMFDPPVSGMMRFAMREGDRISSVNQGVMPLNYVVCWKASAAA